MRMDDGFWMNSLFRLIGLALVIVGLLALYTLFDTKIDQSHNLFLAIVRFLLIVASGVGFVLLRKWGVAVYVASVLANWAAYFTPFDGTVMLTPLWLVLTIPLCVAIICCLGWDRLH